MWLIPGAGRAGGHVNGRAGRRGLGTRFSEAFVERVSDAVTAAAVAASSIAVVTTPL